MKFESNSNYALRLLRPGPWEEKISTHRCKKGSSAIKSRASPLEKIRAVVHSVVHTFLRACLTLNSSQVNLC